MLSCGVNLTSYGAILKPMGLYRGAKWLSIIGCRVLFATTMWLFRPGYRAILKAVVLFFTALGLF